MPAASFVIGRKKFALSDDKNTTLKSVSVYWYTVISILKYLTARQVNMAYQYSVFLQKSPQYYCSIISLTYALDYPNSYHANLIKHKSYPRSTLCLFWTQNSTTSLGYSKIIQDNSNLSPYQLTPLQSHAKIWIIPSLACNNIRMTCQPTFSEKSIQNMLTRQEFISLPIVAVQNRYSETTYPHSSSVFTCSLNHILINQIPVAKISKL